MTDHIKKQRLETLAYRYTDLVGLLEEILEKENISNEMKQEAELTLDHQGDGLLRHVKEDFDLDL